MLRHALRRAARPLARAGFAAEAEGSAAVAATTKAFLDSFVQRAPSTMAPPSFPTDYRAGAARSQPGHPSDAAPFPWPRPVAKRAVPAAGTPDKVTLNLYLPHSIEFQGQKASPGTGATAATAVERLSVPSPLTTSPLQVDQVSIPATTGEFGVLPGHVPTVAQMKPGVLAVHFEADKPVKKARTGATRGRAGRLRACVW